MKFFNSFIGILLLLSTVYGFSSTDKDLILTRSQKRVLDQFKDLVWTRLPHRYMKEDIYLIRWLRARNFNIKEAETMLMQSLMWRKENSMDTVHNEDWSKFRKMYKYWIDGTDKQGRPILQIDVGEWNLRRGVLAGQSAQIARYIDKIFDEINVKLRELQAKGLNVTQYYHIFDMEGYSIGEQGCPICLPLTIRVVTTYETYFPGNCHKIMLVNTPSVFQTLLQILRTFMTPSTRDRLFIYGRDQQESTNALLKDIDKDQLSYELGGTRELESF